MLNKLNVNESTAENQKLTLKVTNCTENPDLYQTAKIVIEILSLVSAQWKLLKLLEIETLLVLLQEVQVRSGCESMCFEKPKEDPRSR